MGIHWIDPANVSYQLSLPNYILFIAMTFCERVTKLYATVGPNSLL